MTPAWSLTELKTTRVATHLRVCRISPHYLRISIKLQALKRHVGNKLESRQYSQVEDARHTLYL